jgi:cytochrome c oxidase assembly factor CtaG
VYAYAALAHRPDGLSALADQRLAAGVMWVPGSLAYSIAIVVFAYRWLAPVPALRGAHT